MLGKSLPDWRPQIIEFPFDTTRAAASLIRGKVPSTFARMRIILAHGGGCLAYLANRMDVLDEANQPACAYSAALRSFRYDTALVHDTNIDHLLGLVPSEHILFGSDAPFCHHFEPEHAARFSGNFDLCSQSPPSA
jgi:predicted TIM-barrel fold metal-dependent hydrolase